MFLWTFLKLINIFIEPESQESEKLMRIKTCYREVRQCEESFDNFSIISDSFLLVFFIETCFEHRNQNKC